jgi:transcriptional regulator with XRE-family HTH domain
MPLCGVFHVGSVIRALRKQRGLGLIDFARRIGISPTTLSRIERTGDNFERATLAKIARGLNVSEIDIYTLQKEGAAGRGTSTGGGRKEQRGEPGGVADHDGTDTDEGRGQPMPDDDQIHGMITALRFAPPERRDEFVQFCISHALGLRQRRRATGTDPNG